MEKFTSQKLHTGKVAQVGVITGKELFKANLASSGNLGVMPFYLICECVEVNGKKIDMEDLQQMPAGDVMALMECISCQLNPTK